MSYQNIAITGASSGIGAQLGRIFAKEGVNFFLCARNEKRLEAMKKELEARGARVEICAFDISDEKKAKEWIERIFSRRIDLLILNAGISSGTRKDLQIELEIAKINALGLACALFYALELMKNQPLQDDTRGQIVLMSSVASLLALPNAPAYSASKHFVSALGEALALAYPQITFTTICPGFIKTPLTAHLRLKMMELEFASEKIARAIKQKKRKFIFPFQTAFVARCYNMLPFWAKKAFVKFLKKRAKL